MKNIKIFGLLATAAFVFALVGTTQAQSTTTPTSGTKQDAKAHPTTPDPVAEPGTKDDRANPKDPTQPQAKATAAKAQPTTHAASDADLKLLVRVCQICDELSKDPKLANSAQYAKLVKTMGGTAKLCPRACNVLKSVQSSGQIKNSDSNFIKKLAKGLQGS